MPIYRLIGRATVRTWTFVEAASLAEAKVSCAKRDIGLAMDGFDPNDSWVVDDTPDADPEIIASEVICPDRKMEEQA